jgi:hypothetical protein
MDCKTARLLLDFHRPTAEELAAPEVADLEAHLAVCPECDALTRAERRADARLAEAMSAVPVPDGLPDRLRARLAADRRADALRKLAWAARGAAVAAALLLAVGLGVLWVRTHPRPLDVAELFNQDIDGMTNPVPERVEEEFARRYDVHMVAPRQFDTATLAYFGMGDCQGKRVPVLVYARGETRAVVYVITREEFNLDKLPADTSSFETNGFRLRIARDGGPPDTAFIIIYSGDSLAPLLRPGNAV